MREMVSDSGTKSRSDMFYMSGDFVIGMRISNIFREVMETGVPFLIDDNRFGLIHSGEADVTVNLINYKLTSGTAAYIGRGSIVQVNHVSDDLSMSGLVMSDELFKLALHGRLPSSFDGRELHFYQQVSEEAASIIDRILGTLWAVVHQEGYSRETLCCLVAAIVHYYDGLQRSTALRGGGRHSREREIFERFIMLVNTECSRERSLSYYAGRMFLTERYLGSVIRQASGTAAKEWIDRAVVTSAKVMLRHSDLPIARIADRLHFANDSFFCKYFRRLTGMTPGEYRR